MATRELTINGVHWTVEYVSPQTQGARVRVGGREAGGLEYVSENGFHCFVPLADTGLSPAEAAFAAASEDLLAQWALRALRRRRPQHSPQDAA